MFFFCQHHINGVCWHLKPTVLILKGDGAHYHMKQRAKMFPLTVSDGSVCAPQEGFLEERQHFCAISVKWCRVIKIPL